MEKIWQNFIENFRLIVIPFHARYEKIKLTGPDEDRVILQSMVDHEAIILKWLDMEIKGEREHSLDAIVKRLQYPLIVQSLPKLSVT